MSGEMIYSSEPPASHFVEGLQLSALFSADVVRSVIQYKPRDDDVFIVTYPKCGTTWTQHILLLIFHHGKPIESQKEFFSAAPFLEVSGVKAAETMPRPGALKIHLPFHLTPWSDKAKYIYVTRNPKDCCVSYYHHMKNIPGHGFKGTFDEFFELFLSGEIDYGDYFDHLMGWYKRRNDPNVLFMTYEELKEDTEASILKLASFIDEEKYAKHLREDPEKLQRILMYSSFKYMKETVNKGFEELFKMPEEEVLKSDLPESMKKMMTAKFPQGIMNENTPAFNFLRKGITGDWKNYFREDQSKRLDKKFAERTKSTDLLYLWKDYM